MDLFDLAVKRPKRLLAEAISRHGQVTIAMLILKSIIEGAW